MTESTYRYQRVSLLGRGAMGEVWLADDVVLGRQVAVKQLRVDPQRGVDAESVERMIREARTAAQLHHRNIVTVFDLQTIDGQPNVVMEFVDGESLAERIARTGPLSVHEAAEVGAQLASGLDLAHRRGIVHRDIKPANILITRDGDAKLADFGIARSLGDPALTGTGAMIGTIAYMSPEVARTGKATAASDVWSLGATLYAAVEGRSPFDDGSGLNTTELLIRVVTQRAPDSRRAGSLAPLLAAMLDPEPYARPSARDVRQALDAAATDAHTAPGIADTVVNGGLAGAEPETRRRPTAGVRSKPVDANATTLRVAGGAAGHAGGRTFGLLAPGPGHRRRRIVLTIVAAVVAGTVAIGGVVVSTSGGGNPHPAAASSSRVIPTTSGGAKPSTANRAPIAAPSPSSGPTAQTASSAPAAIVTQVATRTAAAPAYRRYANPRFGFSVDVPASYSEVTPPADGDGQGFTSPDGSVQLNVYGANNDFGDTPASSLTAAKERVADDGGRTTYSSVRGTVFICSGYSSTGSIFYERSVVYSNVEYTQWWRYPREAKKTLDPTVSHSADSFQPGPNRTG